jgi:hypothetical protein
MAIAKYLHLAERSQIHQRLCIRLTPIRLLIVIVDQQANKISATAHVRLAAGPTPLAQRERHTWMMPAAFAYC